MRPFGLTNAPTAFMDIMHRVVFQEWQMLEVVGQFGLQYRDQAHGVLWSLAVTPSLLSRVIKS